MSLDLMLKFIPLLISLIQVLIWPLIAISILVYLRTPLKKFLEEIIEVTLKAGPIETTAKKQQAMEVAVSLEAATSEKTVDNVERKIVADDGTHEIISLVNQLLTPETSKSLEGTKVLWVDDKPSNNTYERNALEALGLRFTIATSTEDGLEQLRKRNYDLIISDMGRGIDRHAGYTLFEKMKTIGSSAPFIIYAANGSKPEYKVEAAKRGIFASVAGPSRLFNAVIKAHLSQLMEDN